MGNAAVNDGKDTARMVQHTNVNGVSKRKCRDDTMGHATQTKDRRGEHSPGSHRALADVDTAWSRPSCS